LPKASDLITADYSVVPSSTEGFFMEGIPFHVGLVAAFTLFPRTGAVEIFALGLSQKRQMATNPLVALAFHS
jgi:hypothetical protein